MSASGRSEVFIEARWLAAPAGNRRLFDVLCVTPTFCRYYSQEDRDRGLPCRTEFFVPHRLGLPSQCSASVESADRSKALPCSRQTEGLVFCSDKGADFRSWGVNA